VLIITFSSYDIYMTREAEKSSEGDVCESDQLGNAPHVMVYSIANLIVLQAKYSTFMLNFH
jgi:hypothetical protein